MKVRKRVAKVIVFLIRILVFVSLFTSIFEAKDIGISKEIVQSFYLTLAVYICTLVFERLNNIIVKMIVALAKIFIIGMLLGFIFLQDTSEWAIFVRICNFMSYICYAGEQIIRLVFWLDVNKDQ